jgi:hypothetical protein
MTPIDKAPDILGRAILVNVDISAWEARKHDREMTEKVNKRAGAAPDAGRYHKHLFGGRVESLSAVQNAQHALRIMHYEQTLPWTDTGWRLLPTANHTAYTEAYRQHVIEIQKAVDAFVSQYPKLVRDAEKKLGPSMFRARDYPDVNEVRSRFNVSVDYSPVPAEGDFRVTLPKEEMARMEKSVRRRLQEAVKLAMTDAYQRLGEAVSDLREHLHDGKYLRDTMITRISDVADMLGRLNLTDDPNLEQVRKQAIKTLATADITGLRSDAKVRTKVAEDADAILKQMQGYYAPPKEGK